MAAGVSLLTDVPYSSSGDLNTGSSMNTVSTRVPTAKYTKVGETLRHVIPGHMQCSMACGGRACKYENPARWSDKEQAVKGLYSSWITDNLLAMARPSTEILEKYNIIEQFTRCGLRTVINLQRPGEHASCGNPLEHDSGFTYRPEMFMEAGIYFYNFGWKDYGVASLTTILDMVKVMSFAIQEGKMAVHCHAGLGRTGVLLACYLVFTSRMSADQAILFVRAKRPNSIQTRGQLLCVREFAQFLVPLRNVFSCAEPRANAVTLSQYLTRQRHLLHGYEARQMKNVPKIVQLVCKVLLDIAANRQVVVEEEVLEVPDLTAEVEKTVSQQAIQLLGKEMRGKGIPVPSPHLAGPRPETALTQPCPRPETALTQPCPRPETALTQPCPRPETALTQPCSRPETALTQPCSRPETALTQPCSRPETALTQPCPRPETALTQPCSRPETALTQPCPRPETALTQPCSRPETALTQPCSRPETALTQPCPRPETALTQPCSRPETALTHTLHMERPLTPNLALLHEPSLFLEPPLSPALAHDPVLSNDQELDRLWQRQNRAAASLLKPLQPGKRLLSYSDSALYKLDPRRDPDQEQNQVWNIPCCNPLTQHHLATAWEPTASPSLPPQRHPFSMGEQTRDERRGGPYRTSKERDHQTQKNVSPLFQRRKQLCEGQRSLSFGFGGSLYKPSGEELSEGRPWRGDMPVMSLTRGEESMCGVDRAGDREEKERGKAGEREDREEKERGKAGEREDREEKERAKAGEREDGEERKHGEDREKLTDVPVVALYADLSLEARRLLVARALALGLNDEDLHYKVSVWQTELNSREGAWERLSLERDPMVLAGLMWSWLEQLKEPIISSQDVQALGQKNYNSQHALNSLEKGHRLTLLCILDCAAHLLALPDKEEADFLNHTIKVFTKISSESDHVLHQTLIATLTPVLHQLRERAEGEMESTNHSS
ncbi:protein tyrosine phosphatase domain-containing protein 1 isoform X1 [Salmo trutta]|uniref:Protein tyrosine phosphatase domain-containing protein 1 n=2 Tax=Salmo trutta TaxID=8032 RepID=A0A674CE46_SALTR|nr:protein tyrosine phosphatase domain-containing protein 1 isoform X1 [Salmo trutta]